MVHTSKHRAMFDSTFRVSQVRDARLVKVGHTLVLLKFPFEHPFYDAKFDLKSVVLHSTDQASEATYLIEEEHVVRRTGTYFLLNLPDAWLPRIWARRGVSYHFVERGVRSPATHAYTPSGVTPFATGPA